MLLRHAPTPLALVSLSEEWFQADPVYRELDKGITAKV